MLLYLQAGLAVFLLPVNRDSLAARNSISRLVSSSVTTIKQDDFSFPADELNLSTDCFLFHSDHILSTSEMLRLLYLKLLHLISDNFVVLCALCSLTLYFIHFRASSCTSLHSADWCSYSYITESEIT